jgi:hypothetical protein
MLTAAITIRTKRLTNDSILQPFYNILTFTRRLWPHTVFYRPHIVLLLDHILQCITARRWPRGAETCRSVCIYNKHTEVDSLDIIILKADTVRRNNIGAHSRNRCNCGKAKSIHILSVGLHPQLSNMQSACAVLYCNLCPVCLYHIFRHYLVNDTILENKKVLENKIVLIFCTHLSVIFLILRRIQRDTFIKVHKSSRKLPTILFRFQ